MKKILFLIFTVGIISCGDDDEFTVDCLPVHLQNGVISFYPFNDGSLDYELEPCRL